MNLELWPQGFQEAEKIKKEIKKRTVLFYSGRIVDDPQNNQNNPICSFEHEIFLHGSTFGYGAAVTRSRTVKIGEEVKFLTKPNKREGVWNWYAQNQETGETGYIWTAHRSRGTVISRRKGLNKTPTLIGKTGYDKYKNLQDIAFIAEDII